MSASRPRDPRTASLLGRHFHRHDIECPIAHHHLALRLRPVGARRPEVDGDGSEVVEPHRARPPRLVAREDAEGIEDLARKLQNGVFVRHGLVDQLHDILRVGAELLALLLVRDGLPPVGERGQLPQPVVGVGDAGAQEPRRHLRTVELLAGVLPLAVHDLESRSASFTLRNPGRDVGGVVEEELHDQGAVAFIGENDRVPSLCHD